MERHAMDGRERRGVVRVGEVTEMQRREIPMGCPQIELPAPPVSFPLPSVPATFPVWPPPSANPEHAAMTESAEVTHRMVATLLDRSNGPTAPMLLKDAFSTLFAKLDRPSDNANTDLIAELLDFKGRVTERLESQRGDALSAAQAAHAAVFSQCRLAKDTCDGLAIKINEQASIAQAIAFEPLAAAQSALANAEGAKPRREDFPTVSELATWWQNVQDARGKLAGVQGRHTAAMGEVVRLQKELRAAEAEFQRLSGEEQRLSAVAENRATRMLGVETPAPLAEL
jgi:hypothetical protein